MLRTCANPRPDPFAAATARERLGRRGIHPAEIAGTTLTGELTDYAAPNV
ncbi:hypothetical protein [Brevibacillus panacihumi]